MFPRCSIGYTLSIITHSWIIEEIDFLYIKQIDWRYLDKYANNDSLMTRCKLELSKITDLKVIKMDSIIYARSLIIIARHQRYCLKTLQSTCI